MAPKISPEEAALRRDSILKEARWCFLNFGYAKTSLDDIAKRASISRTLLYKTFKDKEDIYGEVFRHWLVSRHPAATAVVASPGTPFERLMEITRIMVIDPWADMVGAPMSGEFFEVCERLDPEVDAMHRQVLRDGVAAIIKDPDAADIYVLSLDGLLGDEPSVDEFRRRVRVLAGRFTPISV